MSSLVQAKWVSSLIRVQVRVASSLPRTKYSTAFTSCRVVASSSASSAMSSWPKSGTERPQRADLFGGQRAGAEQAVVGEVEQPLHLDVHARAVQRGFRELLAQAGHGGAVAAVERAQRLFWQGGS